MRVKGDARPPKIEPLLCKLARLTGWRDWPYYAMAAFVTLALGMGLVLLDAWFGCQPREFSAAKDGPR